MVNNGLEFAAKFDINFKAQEYIKFYEKAEVQKITSWSKLTREMLDEIYR
jgi:hypothetical protein